MEIKKVIKHPTEPKPEITIDLSAYHRELEKVSPKFVGLCAKGNEIIQIVVEDDFGDPDEVAPIMELNNKLQELLLNPDFGKKQ